MEHEALKAGQWFSTYLQEINKHENVGVCWAMYGIYICGEIDGEM